MDYLIYYDFNILHVPQNPHAVMIDIRTDRDFHWVSVTETDKYSLSLEINCKETRLIWYNGIIDKCNCKLIYIINIIKVQHMHIKVNLNVLLFSCLFCSVVCLLRLSTRLLVTRHFNFTVGKVNRYNKRNWHSYITRIILHVNALIFFQIT